MPINYPHGQKRTQFLFLLSGERLCCCDPTRNYTGTLQKSGVAPQQQEIPGMKIVPGITNISGIPKESQRHNLTGVLTLLH